MAGVSVYLVLLVKVRPVPLSLWIDLNPVWERAGGVSIHEVSSYCLSASVSLESVVIGVRLL